MILAAPAALAKPTSRLRMSVVIPARNEAGSIQKTLAALGAQTALDGRRLPDGFFEVIVFANNCDDDTAQVVRAFAARVPHIAVHTIEARLPGPSAHVGTARKAVMDLAAARFASADRADGIVASIDSDTVADPRWVAAIVHEIAGRDAVAGHVAVGAEEQGRFLAPVRLLYARELTYRGTLALVEGLIDPVPEDPLPRHSSFVGASFAVTAAMYGRAGGIPPLACLEDLGFARALRRIDARIRYSPLVRATTSARLAPRVRGGFGSFLGEMHACARRGSSFTVEHPLRSLEDIRSRAALRRIRSGDARRADIQTVSQALNLPSPGWLPLLDRTLPLGTVFEQIVERAQHTRRRYPPVAVEHAIGTLQSAARRAQTHQPIVRARPTDAREAG